MTTLICAFVGCVLQGVLVSKNDLFYVTKKPVAVSFNIQFFTAFSLLRTHS